MLRSRGAFLHIYMYMHMAKRQGFQRFKLTGVRNVGKELGRGAYAAVVELQFRGLKCAGKKLHRSLFDNAPPRQQEGLLQRFETECEILSELRHPRVVQFMGVHFEAGSILPVLVMEFLHTTLTACLDRYGTLPQEISYTILDDVATALCYLHGQNPVIIHRDLSANNVLLTSDMRAKISDMGVARILNLTPAQRTQMTTAPGTQSCMPPEALSHNPTYDTKIDCFSFGVIALHMFCGRWPIPDEATRVNPSNPHQLIPLSETERRNKYLQEIGENHPLMALIRECLSNHPPHRPDAVEILQRVREVFSQFPPSFENKVEMLHQWRTISSDEPQRCAGKGGKLFESLEVEQTRIKLSELNAEKEGLSALLRAKEKEHDAKLQELNAKQQELSAVHLDVAAKELLLHAKQQELDAKQEEISAKDSILAAKEATVDGLKDQLIQVQQCRQVFVIGNDSALLLCWKIRGITLFYPPDSLLSASLSEVCQSASGSRESSLCSGRRHCLCWWGSC